MVDLGNCSFMGAGTAWDFRDAQKSSMLGLVRWQTASDGHIEAIFLGRGELGRS